MAATSIVQATLLSRLNERRVFHAFQTYGPLSRAEAARRSGVSPPTASKAVEALLKAGLLEEGDSFANLRGRPARTLRLAVRNVQVLGIVIDAEQCSLVAAGLDGSLCPNRSNTIATPSTYEQLIDGLVAIAKPLINERGFSTLGIGISVPGLMDYRDQRGILSPNVPITNGQTPGHDLAERLGVDCVMVQESHGLCLAEKHFGAARGLRDFAVIDISTGVGMGVFAGGRLLYGNAGHAGEIGHVAIVPDGERCGCGGVGCLETVASEPTFLRAVSRRVGKPISMDEAVEMLDAGNSDVQSEFRLFLTYLGIGVGGVVNVLNPAKVFLHGRLVDKRPSMIGELIPEIRPRSLNPSFSAGTVEPARSTKPLGAIAGIIEYLADKLAPGILGHESLTGAQSSDCPDVVR